MPGVDFAPDLEVPVNAPRYHEEGQVGNVRTAAQLDERAESEVQLEARQLGRLPSPGSPKPHVVDFDPNALPEAKPGTPPIVDFDPDAGVKGPAKPKPLADILKEREAENERSSERPERHPSVVPNRSRKPEK